MRAIVVEVCRVQILWFHDSLKSHPWDSLLAELAKDIRQEFFPFVRPVMEALIEIVDPRNAETLEPIFTCIAYIFKFCLKQMVSNIYEMYR